MLEQNQEFDAEKAIHGLPQGHRADADLASNHTATGEAIEPHDPAKPIATEVEGAASAAMPQGQRLLAASLDDICGQLMQLQRNRVFAIQQQIRCDNAVLAYIRSNLGFTTDGTRMSEDERRKVSAQARRIKQAVETGSDQDENADKAVMNIIATVSPVILRGMIARQTWDEMRAATEKAMRTLAKELPVLEFVEQTKGLSFLGLAAIVGEAHNLGLYPKKGHLWKRLGLAVVGDKRQGNPGTGATAEDWIAHGYVARRRAEIYAFIDDTMLRRQWRREKDGKPAHATGPYGEYYARKKAAYLDRGWEKGHADKAARRYMAKMLIRDLWKAWRLAASKMPEGHGISANRHTA